MLNNINKIIYTLYGCRTVGWALPVSFFLISSPIAGNGAGNTADDWHVMCLNGDWHKYSTAIDTRGVELHNDGNVEGGALIRLLGTLSKDKYIVINYRNDPERLIRKDCANWNDCSRPIFLPKLGNDSRKANWIEEARSYLDPFEKTEETLASMHRMRAIPERQEGIGRIVDDDPQVDLTEVKRYMKKGFYSLTLVDKGSAVSERKFFWDPTTTVVKIEGSSLTPGLYEISPLEDQGISVSIWLCAGQQCSQAQVRFQMVQSSIDECGTDDRYHDYLMVYLGYLARTSVARHR